MAALTRVRAIEALTRQLGPRWQGPEAAAPDVRVLFVAFALHWVERRDEAIGLLGEVSASLSAAGEEERTGPDAYLVLPETLVRRVDALLQDRGWFSDAEQAAARHAYTTPALMTVLNTARLRAGVLAPAQFAWLKLVDRPLWYALHSLGFESEGIGRYLHPNARVEAAGARDHWASERAAGQPVTWPSFRAGAAIASTGPRGQDGEATDRVSAVRSRCCDTRDRNGKGIRRYGQNDDRDSRRSDGSSHRW